MMDHDIHDEDDDEIYVKGTVAGAGLNRANSLAGVKTTISKYNQVKIFNLDSGTGCFKKYSLKTNDGRLKIYLNESLNKVFLLIYSIDEKSLNRIIYDELNLNDIEYSIADFNYINTDQASKSRIELKKKHEPGENYALEFFDEQFYDQLTSTLNYLNEIYNQQNGQHNGQDMAAGDYEMNEINNGFIKELNYEDVVPKGT